MSFARKWMELEAIIVEQDKPSSKSQINITCFPSNVESIPENNNISVARGLLRGGRSMGGKRTGF
jgi:hypothetical protein